MKNEKCKFVTPYGPKDRVHGMVFEPSPFTDQSAKDEADINTIMAKYQSTGELPVLNLAEANWLDVSEMEFQQHMNSVIEAQAMFAQLPSKIRDRFGNDPGAFLAFTSDAENITEIAKMGLLTPEATQKILNPQTTSESES